MTTSTKKSKHAKIAGSQLKPTLVALVLRAIARYALAIIELRRETTADD
jgi:hypothetical protein